MLHVFGYYIQLHLQTINSLTFIYFSTYPTLRMIKRFCFKVVALLIQLCYGFLSSGSELKSGVGEESPIQLNSARAAYANR